MVEIDWLLLSGPPKDGLVISSNSLIDPVVARPDPDAVDAGHAADVVDVIWKAKQWKIAHRGGKHYRGGLHFEGERKDWVNIMPFKALISDKCEILN